MVAVFTKRFNGTGLHEQKRRSMNGMFSGGCDLERKNYHHARLFLHAAKLSIEVHISVQTYELALSWSLLMPLSAPSMVRAPKQNSCFRYRVTRRRRKPL